MEQTLLIQTAATIASGMAGALYGRHFEIEAARITEIAMLSVELARAIETEAQKKL